MGKETFLEKIKTIVYHIVLPIYLWSIGEKSLDSYIENIVDQEIQFRNQIKDNIIIENN